ncbi:MULTISPECIES: hypothetical protein [unclassified Curtobacterium]|uniref:hypothetical protein n=1 Tax=unclassified Curtobacterium TaxID=257496 RepID=UPI0038194280
MKTGEEARELLRRTPCIVNLLSADSNQDWDLDHLDAESVSASTIDRLAEAVVGRARRTSGARMIDVPRPPRRRSM